MVIPYLTNYISITNIFSHVHTFTVYLINFFQKTAKNINVIIITIQLFPSILKGLWKIYKDLYFLYLIPNPLIGTDIEIKNHWYQKLKKYIKILET